MPVRGEMQRTLQQITIGDDLRKGEREERYAELDLLEIELQYQLPIEGIAAPVPGWGTVEVEFEWEFFYAPAQRDSDLDWPQMTYGAYIERGGPVGVLACVTGWKINEPTAAIIGATIAVAAIGPVEGQQFAGTLDVTFQGFASSRDDFDDTGIQTGEDI